ncbi:MAG: hypothetical protein ACRDJC_11705 [Thermomicrobiales bacterium]
MTASHLQIRGVRRYVVVFSLVGLALTLLLAFVRDERISGFGNEAFVVLSGGPFLLALFSLALHRVEHQRWVWLACALLIAAGVPLIFNGVGIYFLAIAIGFAWAFVTTR